MALQAVIFSFTFKVFPFNCSFIHNSENERGEVILNFVKIVSNTSDKGDRLSELRLPDVNATKTHRYGHLE